MPLANVEQAIADVRAGKFVIIVDDEDRENEGDLAIAADAVTPEAINFMTKAARGLICVPMTARRLAELGLEPMVSKQHRPLRHRLHRLRRCQHRRLRHLCLRPRRHRPRPDRSRLAPERLGPPRPPLSP